MKTILHFTEFVRYCDYRMARAQVRAIDLISGKSYLLVVTRSSSHYPKLCNLSYKGSFISVAQFDHERLNNIRLLKNDPLELEHPELFI
jgi:hypothetical protein